MKKTTKSSKTMQIVGSFAEFERAMLRERTCNGLNAARKEGRIGGRRHKLTVNQQQEIVQLISSGKNLNWKGF